MRPSALVICAALALPACADEGDPARGQAVFASACARCHAAPEALDLPEAAAFDDFLATHKKGTREAATRADLIAYLLSLHEEGEEG